MGGCLISLCAWANLEGVLLASPSLPLGRLRVCKALFVLVMDFCHSIIVTCTGSVNLESFVVMNKISCIVDGG